MPTLTIQLPGQPPVEHVLREEAISLGRATGNRIALDNSSVSQAHATITHVASDYFLKDLKSTNGTMLNGQSISETRLRDGDVLRLGEVVAVFWLEPVFAPGPLPTAAAINPTPVPVAKPAKSDTSILSAKAKTTLLKPVSPEPGSIPETLPPKKRNPIPLAASIFAGVLTVGALGFFAWKLANSGASKPSLATQSDSTPQTAPAQINQPTNAQAEVAEPSPTVEPPATNLSTPPSPVADTTNTPALPETTHLAEWLGALRSQDVAERRHAAQAICDLESGATNALLNLRLALLQDSDPEVRLWLVIALVKNQIHDPATVSILIEGLQLESTTLRQRACATLGLIQYDESDKAAVVAALRKAIEDDDESVRKAALDALNVIATGEATTQ